MGTVLSFRTASPGRGHLLYNAKSKSGGLVGGWLEDAIKDTVCAGWQM